MPRAVPPAEPFAETERRIAAAVERSREEILALSHAIHADPEPAFEEVRAGARVAEAIRRHGYEVEHPVGRLATAVRGRMHGALGGARPRIAILAEYDALPGLGHGCGHNTMAASGVGAALALAALADRLPGEIVFLGTPAEERGNGKQIMIDDGLFEGVDAALLFHPGDRTNVEARLLASQDVEIVFHGLQAHAAADPWEGKNALDALILLFNAVALWRQQLRPDARVHGIVREGGTAANVIPARTAAWFMIRSISDGGLAAMQERFRAIVGAAAMAADCSVEVDFSLPSSTMRHNRVLGERFSARLAVHGLTIDPPDPNLGSSDMGNVSQVCPTIHPGVAICAVGTPGHSLAFRDAAAGPRADEVTLLMARMFAELAAELLLDPALVEAAWRDFHASA